jgi:hypothetical protein
MHLHILIASYDGSQFFHDTSTFLLFSYRARDKRQMEEGLQRVVTLGAAEAEVDDMAAWVARSRAAEEESKRGAQRAGASRLASMYDEEVWQSSASFCEAVQCP